MPGQLCPQEQYCTATESRPRHHHVAQLLNLIGERCRTCNVADWRIWFGHPLPALVRCGQCGRGFNLSERLQATTRPQPRGGLT